MFVKSRLASMHVT